MKLSDLKVGDRATVELVVGSIRDDKSVFFLGGSAESNVHFHPNTIEVTNVVRKPV